MKKAFTITLLYFFSLSSISVDLYKTISIKNGSFVAADDKSVFICDSQTAKKYHFSKDCKGLSNCKHKIIEVTITKATNSGRTLCGWED